MGVGVQLILLVSLFGGSIASRGRVAWEYPPFEEPAGDPEYLSFGDFDPVRDTQIINLDENKENVAIAKIKYTGINAPTIGRFWTGSSIYLGAEIKKEADGFYYVFITKPQDYETEHNRVYAFNIDIEPNFVAVIDLRINNLDDTPPVLELVGGRCEVEEGRVYISDDCQLRLYDADGILTDMKYDITGNEGVEKIFNIVKTADVDAYTLLLNLEVLIKILYKEVTVFVLTVKATDSGGNPGTILLQVHVKDMPGEPPKWVMPLAVESFDELEEMEFEVKAMDGDTGIDKPIKYELIWESGADYSSLIELDEDTGKIKVAIDRDAVKMEIFRFSIRAYKVGTVPDEEGIDIKSSATFIVNDINNKRPEISTSDNVYELDIPETMFVDLEFKDLLVNDEDLGPNAVYTVKLESIGVTKFHEAFTIIPSKGYQDTNIILTILKANMLDFEDSAWRTIEMEIVATETAIAVGDTENDPLREERRLVIINLKNRNDELPIFSEPSGYVMNVKETVGKNFRIIQTKATDRDVDDDVVYSLVEPIDSILSIDKDGYITTKVDDAFDVDVQSKLLVQIIARDILIDDYDCPKIHCHETISQLTLTIDDVNNKAPTLRTPSVALSVKENEPDGFEINLNQLLTGSDPDDTADLEFGIDWDSSSATKNGEELKEEDKHEYRNCLEIVTVRDPTTNKKVTGVVTVREIRPGVTIDYEKFTTMFLTIYLKDHNTEEDFIECCKITTATLTIRIIDENDNAPVFENFPIREVLDAAALGTIFMTVKANDADDPPYNDVSYSLMPSDDKEKVLEIDEKSGEISVIGEINADVPPRHTLDYTVIAGDGDPNHNVEKKLIIPIKDVNNRKPTEDENNESTFEVFEDKKSGHVLGTIKGHDLDRDPPNNEWSYSLNFDTDEARNLFKIDEITGVLSVELQNGKELDRDVEPSSYVLTVVLRDRRGQQITIETLETSVTKTIILLDVNDNKPLLPETLTQTKISENQKPGETFVKVVANDTDEGVNAEIDYFIEEILPGDNNFDPPSGYEDLFEIETDSAKKVGTIKVKKLLKSYHGYWNLKLRTKDGGTPSLEDTRTYNIEIVPYNFNIPQFVYPDRPKIYLKKEELNIGSDLRLANGYLMNPLTGKDDDGGVNGDLEFKITSEFFAVQKIDNKRARLVLKTLDNLPEVNELSITLTDAGIDPQPYSTTVLFTFNFITTTGAPIFDLQDHTKTYQFSENATGFEEENALPDGYEPKNEGIEEGDGRFPWSIYYHIMEIEDYQYFKIEKRVGITDKYFLKLEKMLDYEEKTIYTLQIALDNSETKPTSPNAESVLKITINVIDINDNPPVFEQPLYRSGLTSQDVLKQILTVKAIDLDTDDHISYTILKDTMTVSDSSLQPIVDSIFVLHKESGILTQGTEIQSGMTGFFEFLIEARDKAPENHTDTTEIKIYILANEDRITFVFQNNIETIDNNRDVIQDVFSTNFKLSCNIDSVKVQSSKTTRAEGFTDVMVHFVDDNNEVVKGTTIKAMVGDQDLKEAMDTQFLAYDLRLKDMSTKNEDIDSLAETLKTILIVVSVVLGILCVVMFLAFIIRTRSLNRQLKAATVTTFGSQSSELNRIGIKSAPTTNIYSVERSNPVMSSGQEESNNKNMFAEAENQSSDDDDDLIGVENNPEFSYNNTKNTKGVIGNGDALEDGRRKSNNPLGMAKIDIDMNVPPSSYQEKY